MSRKADNDSNIDDDPPMDLDDDNNEQADLEDGNEDPFVMAIDDLEGRVITAINALKTHPGVRSTDARYIHDELQAILHPVLEVAAHTAPSVARTYYRGEQGVEAGVEQAFERIISDLVLPVLLESAQSDPIPVKRGTCLEFYRILWKECHKPGSWIDTTTTGPNAGPYGAGGATAPFANTPAGRATLKRRQQKTQNREGEILRYWVESASACLVEGVFTAEEYDVAAVCRGILAASGVLRPALGHISQRIRDADDRGAVKLFNPVMRMVGGVLKKLFLGTNDEVRSTCLKFLEIVVLCCSHKPEDPNAAARRRGPNMAESFSLSDLPTGHPTITRESLESIAEYAFTTLRGVTLLGGQVKIDVNVLSDMMLGGGSSPSDQVVSILKPAALAYLDLEAYANIKDSDLDVSLGGSEMEFDFRLSQRGYIISINAVASIALQRPAFFKEAALCLARKSIKPPKESDSLDRAGYLLVGSQLRSTCLTLLRNVLSVTSGAATMLHGALSRLEMTLQADKALEMANHANKLKSASRSARNQAKMFYEWDRSDTAGRSTKRQKETDDALAKMRAAKKARGLGHGIQLPSNMVEATELAILNLQHFSLVTRPKETAKRDKGQVSLDFLIDAIMTNGKSLVEAKGGWFDRDGGSAWIYDPNSGFSVTPSLLSAMEQSQDSESSLPSDYSKQCEAAAAKAFNRILAVSANARPGDELASLSHQLAARLALILRNTRSLNGAGYASAKNCLLECKKVGYDTVDLEKFVDEYPLVAEATAASVVQQLPEGADSSLYESLLMESLMRNGVDEAGALDAKLYDLSLELYVAMVVYAGTKMIEKPSDLNRRKEALTSSVNLRRGFGAIPRLPPRILELFCEMCNVEELSRKSIEASKPIEGRNSAAAVHAAKDVAEKRAETALFLLLESAFHRSSGETRKQAVGCAVGIASGRKPSSHSVHGKALKMTLNVLFSKGYEDLVVEAAIHTELEWATDYAISSFDSIEAANNKAAEAEKKVSKRSSTGPRSEAEKKTMERLRRCTDLIMAIGVRRPEVIRFLFSSSCRDKADVLSRTVQANMQKLTTATATRFGTAAIAEMVAGMTTPQETPMLLDFLEKLVPAARLDDSNEIIQVCLNIQNSKTADNGKKDNRFLVPVLSIMKRVDIAKQLALFCASEDHVFVAALVRMGEKLGRQMLLFREEPDGDNNPLLRGMTLCEQLVFLHKLDFAAEGLPQKRYLACIKLCLDQSDLFNDQVWFAAFDYMSGTFIASEKDNLPLGFMRSVILVCTKHETLHSWICNVLLKRLVEGEIWNRDERQWEGWMRCAKILEGRVAGAPSSAEAVAMLPDLQQLQYRSKWSQ